jgi:hypothetical protein
MGFDVLRPPNVETFLGAASDYLGAHEAEHNLLFGICSVLRILPDAYGDEPARFAVVRRDGHVMLVGLRTPPGNQILSLANDSNAVDALAEALRDEPIPGVLGPVGVIESFVASWSRMTNQTARLEVEERIFRLTSVRPPERRAAGSWRLLEPRDRDLLAEWLVDFVTEATHDDPPTMDQALQSAERWVERVARTGYVWEDEGTQVSFVGATGETPNGIRIGPVYTPPERRGRGYASSLTAAASADQLARGRRFCFLFTDLTNPTSNKIYETIGYQRVCDVNQYRFHEGAPPAI